MRKNPIVSEYTFLCLELCQNPETDLNNVIAPLEKVANTINQFYDNDLYLITQVYLDKDNRIHASILISDIEKSLSASSEAEIPPEVLIEILRNTLPEYSIGDLTHCSAFLFHDTSQDSLSYYAVIHIRCPIIPLNAAEPHK